MRLPADPHLIARPVAQAAGLNVCAGQVDNPADRANSLIRRYVLNQCYRASERDIGFKSSPGTNQHLLGCPNATVDVSVEQESWFDTGVPGLTFDAVVSCPHGEREDYTYGELGELPDLIAELIQEEAAMSD